jgi:hypothetical protein
LGIAQDKVEQFTTVMAKLATTTDLSADEAATMLAQFANITGLNDYERLGSVIAELGDATATTASKVVQMSQGMAASASIAGMSPTDIMAIAAAVGSLGVEAQAGSTAMSTLINTLYKATETGENLEAFAAVAGMSAEQFKQAWGENAVGAMDEMNFFGLPEYLVALCSRDFILRDCMAAAAMDHISLPERDLMLLDYIIYSGKILYFLDQVLPETSDEVKLRYTPDQMAWMRQNVKEVWGWMVQKEMLFSTDRLQLRNLTGDAPKTNAFGDGSAPRTGDYIGWQIVSAYMEKNDVSLSELFAETNSQKILEQSGWRPEK